jgi:C-terminal processing protease CtpA/Prc
VHGVRGTAITTYNDDPNDPSVFLIADDGTVLAAKDGTDFDNEKHLEMYRDYRTVKGIKVNFEHFYPDSKYGDYLVKAVEVRVNVESDELEKYFAVKEGGDAQADKALGLKLNSNDNQDFSGFVVLKVTPGGPAESAGVQPGDTLLEIDGVNVEQADHRSLVQLSSKSGAVIVLTVKRGEQTLKINVTRGP